MQCLQETDTGPYPVQFEFSTDPHMLFL